MPPQRGEKTQNKAAKLLERKDKKEKQKQSTANTKKKKKQRQREERLAKGNTKTRGERAPVFVAAERPKTGDTHTAAQQGEKRQPKRLQKGSTAATILSKVCSLIIASSKKRA